MSKPIFSTSESLQSAHEALVSSLTPTMPILLHGSGDVEPPRVDPATARLVADLTAAYVGQLVDAAVDAHDILTDGAGGIRPPPGFPRDDAVSAKRNSSVSMAAVKQSEGSSSSKRRTRRTASASASSSSGGGGGGGGGGSGANVVPGSIDDCWDDVEVPLPKVRKTSAGTSPSPAAAAGTRSALLPSRTMPTSTSTSTDRRPNSTDGYESTDWDWDSGWAGLAGVDLFGPRRRVPYAGPPYTIETKSFIFPVCHDPTLYGRIMEVQKARRTIAPLLVDPILRDMVRGEGREVVRAIEAGRRLGEGEALVVGGAGSGAGAGGAGGGSGTASDGGVAAAAAASAAAGGGGGGADDGSGADTEMEKDSAIMTLRNGVADGAVWPGLGDLLPTYTTKTLAEATADEVADNSTGRKRKMQRVSFASKGTKST